MRILVVNWQDLRHPSAGGAEVHLQEIFSRLARGGHAVDVLCSSFPGARGEESTDGIRIIRRGSRSLFNFSVPGMYRRLRKNHYDVIVEDLNKIPFFTPLYVREPLAGIAHHRFGRSIFRETNPLASCYVAGMEKVALRLYARRRIPFAVYSNSTLEDLVAHGFHREDLFMVPLAVDHTLLARPDVPRSPTPLVGCFGRLKRYKSVDVLLRALVQVARQVPDLSVVVVGDGDDRERLERLSRELGVAPRVRFAGFVSEVEKAELLHRIWFTVSTSAKEGWGLTVTEGNACGVPAVASDVPGLRDAVRDGETGLLYPFGDVGGLAQAMLRLLQDPGLRENLSRKALAYARTFNWEISAQKMFEFLEVARSRKVS